MVGKSTQTLAWWRSAKRNDLPYLKIGGHVRYDKADVEKFLEACRKDNK